MVNPYHVCYTKSTSHPSDIVLSIHERPAFGPCPSRVPEDVYRRDLLRSMRSNTLKVLRQQSNEGLKIFDNNPLSMRSTRQALKREVERRSIGKGLTRLPSDSDMLDQARFNGKLGTEGASNLFYYLFEDYAAATPLSIAGRRLNEIVSYKSSKGSQ
jgi:hypothetical protein